MMPIYSLHAIHWVMKVFQKPPSEEHYLLTAKDVVECTLVAPLVVLSCCHSGRGQISSEGVVGIGRFFLGAGARSVLVTNNH